MEIYERLFITMQEKDIMQKDIIDNINGVSKSTISAWKTRKIDPPSKFIVPLANLLNVSVEYLLTGENKGVSSKAFPKDTITPSEKEFLAMLRQLPLEQQAEMRGELRAMVKMFGDKSNADAV